jgi:hypothetical protein
MVPDPDAVIDELAETVDEVVTIVALPWSPPEAGPAEQVQRRLLDSTGELGVEAAWLFQISTTPPAPPSEVRFPVDGLPDLEHSGIAFKLAGPPMAGTRSVLAAFHALWLAPYRRGFRAAGMIHDHTHHAGHMWIDHVSSVATPAQLGADLLSVASKIDAVFSIVHARFGGPPSEPTPVVLGGNPLRAIYAAGGEAGVDRWISAQDTWSGAEVARMLSHLAHELITGTTS